MEWTSKQQFLHEFLTEAEKEEDEDIPFEVEEEEQFRTYLIRNILLNKGFKRYAQELLRYYVNFTDDPTISAAVNSTDRIVIINENIVKKLNEGSGKERREIEARISMLIRHELLHSMLNHHKRALIAVAKKLGYDPFKMTEDQFHKVLSRFARPSLLFRLFNFDPETGKSAQIRNDNGAGDMDLSRNYLEEDIRIQKLQHGLLLEDHPDWVTYSFEEIYDALQAKERALKLRLHPIVYYDEDENGNMVIDHEEPGWFSQATEFAAEDVLEVRIPTIEEVEEFKKYFNDVPSWLYMNKVADDLMIPVIEEKKVKEKTCTEEYFIWPVFRVDNLDLYSKLFESFEENNKQYADFKCLGEYVRVLPSGLVIALGPLDYNGETTFVYADEPKKEFTPYDNSNIKRILRLWAHEKMEGTN